MIDADLRTLDALGHAPDEDHLPAPLDHASVVEAIATDAHDGLSLQERHTGAIITCDYPVKVEQ